MPTAAKGESIAGDAIINIVRFPLWWYTTGVMYTMQRLIMSVQYYARVLAIGVWLRNILVPMYGFYDWQSRIISFFMRSAQIVFRGIALLLWVCICFAQLVVYIALPLIALGMIGYFLYAAAA